MTKEQKQEVIKMIREEVPKLIAEELGKSLVQLRSFFVKQIK